MIGSDLKITKDDEHLDKNFQFVDNQKSFARHTQFVLIDCNITKRKREIHVVRISSIVSIFCFQIASLNSYSKKRDKFEFDHDISTFEVVSVTIVATLKVVLKDQ